MNSKIAVSKMHGARNDFIVVDLRTQHVAALPEFARRACDRFSGIGADGVVAIHAVAGGVGMQTINADGSRAEMCGNGVRCAARWLDEAGEGSSIDFHTEAGIVHAQIVTRDPHYLVRVNVGIPSVMPITTVCGDAFAVNVGNPHAVFFSRDIDAVDLPALASRMQNESLFSNGANVHIVNVCGWNQLAARFWERGVGLTQACGTGAVAAAAAAIASGKVASPVDVRAPGGTLAVEWDGRGMASLTGPAVRVFDTCVSEDL